MKSIRLNETKLYNEIIALYEEAKKDKSKEEVFKNSFSILDLIIKDKISKGWEYLEIREYLYDFIETMPKTYRVPTDIYPVADNKLKRALELKEIDRYNSDFVDINEVVIYKQEIEYIKSVNDKKVEKLLFILLVYLKAMNEGSKIVYKERFKKYDTIRNFNGKLVDNLHFDAGIKIVGETLKIDFIVEVLNKKFECIDVETGELVEKYYLDSTDRELELKLNYVFEKGEVCATITDFQTEGENKLVEIFNEVFGYKCSECGAVVSVRGGICGTCRRKIEAQKRKAEQKKKEAKKKSVLGVGVGKKKNKK